MGNYEFTDADMKLDARNRYIKDHAHRFYPLCLSPTGAIHLAGSLFDAIETHTEESEQELAEKQRG